MTTYKGHFSVKTSYLTGKARACLEPVITRNRFGLVVVVVVVDDVRLSNKQSRPDPQYQITVS